MEAIRAQSPPSGLVGGEPPTFRDEVNAKRIVLRAGDGKASIVLQAMQTGVGIWLSSGDGQECLCLVAGLPVGPGAYFGVYPPKAESGCALAACAEGVQVVEGEDVAFFSLAEVVAAFKAHRP